MQQYLDWGWSDASSAFDRVLVPSAVARPDELGRVDRLLLAATDRAELAPLTRRDGRRVTVAEAYLWPVAGQIDIRTGTGLDRVVVDGEGAAVGVVLVDGTRIDADAVVLAAGAIHSPCILQRSGVEGSGRGLRDHPAAGLVLRLGPGRSEGAMEDASHHDHALGLATASFATFGPVQVLALNHLGRQGPADLAMLLVALMTPTGTGGTVTIATDDPTVGPRVDFDLLSTSADRTALRAGVRAVADLLTEAPFADAVTDVFVDDRGTRLAELDLDDDTSLDAWLMAHTADYVHASSSCADVVDVGATGDGSVRGCSRLFVCDASAFPDIPDANTHLPTMMLAERLAARWTGRELHTTARPSRHGRINR